MTALGFAVVGVDVDRFAVNPQLLFRIHVDEATGMTVHAMVLRVQLMIEPQRRTYTDSQSATLGELFGTRDRWKDTLRPFLWTVESIVVPGFTGGVEFDLPVRCSYDVEVISGKYLHALCDGDIPVRLLFSGTVFTRSESGFGVELVDWNLEAEHRLSARLWHDLMDQFYPGQGWIRLSRDSIDTLLRVRAERGITSWDSLVEQLAESFPAPSGVTS